jgi:hypothetical protein
VGTALKPWIILTALAGLAACASPPQLTREQWLAETTRTYPNHTPAQVLDAAREVFVLADGDDFVFGYPDALTMTASRFWMVYAVLSGVSGTDMWRVTVDASGQAHVSVERQWPVTNPHLYRLFWDRLEYALGERDVWASCEDYRYSSTLAPGGLDALCSGVTLADNQPQKN